MERALLEVGAAWVRWRDRLGAQGILDGTAWRGIARYGTRPQTGGLHRGSVAEIIKRRAAAAGLDDADRRRRQDALARLTPVEFETLLNTAHAA